MLLFFAVFQTLALGLLADLIDKKSRLGLGLQEQRFREFVEGAREEQRNEEPGRD